MILIQTDMHGESPYNVMFGPDICGPGTKKVHVIFNHKGKNLLTKKTRMTSLQQTCSTSREIMRVILRRNRM